MLQVKQGKVVTFGEIMLRLNSPGRERLLQSPALEATFGGGEANVAISLANFGIETQYVTALPSNPIGDAAVRVLQSFNVNTSAITRRGDRVGIYYLETGSGPRASKVIYDRANSAMATCKPADFKWDKIFAGASWFHVTGITPALSQSAADATAAALKAAKKAGLVTSCDLNYRAKLWKYGKAAPDIMRDLVPLTDVVIANEEDIQMSLGIALDQKIGGAALSQEKYAKLTLQVMHEFSNLELVAVTLRESLSADHNVWGAMYRLKDLPDPLFSKKHDLTHIVDRVGGGDAFAAGLIYSYLKEMKPAEALEFAVAASALKHTFVGDFNLATVDEVKALAAGEASGRVQR